MKVAARSRGNKSPIAVGVYDEPELIVCGVEHMLSRSGRRADVVTIAPDSGLEAIEVDVLLCDPVGRAVQIEDYLGEITALTVAPVLVFTWSSSPSSVRRSLATGACGFVSKGASWRPSRPLSRPCVAGRPWHRPPVWAPFPSAWPA